MSTNDLVKWLIETRRYHLDSQGKIISASGAVLRNGKTKRYPKMEVMGPDGIIRHISKHTFVAIALWGPIPAGFTVNHKDGKKWNNDPDNLEVVHHSNNIKHSYKNGLQPPTPLGEEHWGSKLSNSDVAYVRRERARGVSGRSLADELGVSYSLIYAISRGERRKHS